jgi:YD repeat-containing protein
VTDPAGIIHYDYYSSGLVKRIDALGNLTEFTYDAAGNQLSLNDPDAGLINYTYNAYGQLTSQIDSKGNSYALSYDELNRLSEKNLLGIGTQARYTYYDNFLSPGYGMVEIIEGSNGISYTYDYDQYSRLHTEAQMFDGLSLTTEYTYATETGKLFGISYPTDFQTQYDYDVLSGDLVLVTDASQQMPLWQANTTNARGQLTSCTTADGSYTIRNYDQYGFPSEISVINIFQNDPEFSTGMGKTNTGEYLQNLVYQFNPVTGNLTSRVSIIGEVHLSEAFSYDELLNTKLTSWQVTGQDLQQVLYYTNRNIRAKSGITSEQDPLSEYSSVYQYGQGAGPHAVTTVTIPTEEYSNHSTPQEIAYTAFNKISSITQEFGPPSDDPGDDVWRLDVIYGPDEQRKKSQLFLNDRLMKTKYFLNDLYEEELFERVTRKLHYLYASDGLFAIYVMNGETDTMKINYFHSFIPLGFSCV